MGTDISFLLERHSSDRHSSGRHNGTAWESPLDWIEEFPDANARSTVLEVCWWPARRALTSLFFGPYALLSFNAGLPVDMSTSVRERCEPNFQDNGSLAGWQLVSNLLISEWETTSVTVSAKCPAKHALLFWDGLSEYDTLLKTIDKLKAPQSEKIELQLIVETGKLIDKPIDVRSLEDRHRKQSPDSLVDVSWVQTLSCFAGAIYREMKIVDALNQDALSRDEMLRLVTAIG